MSCVNEPLKPTGFSRGLLTLFVKTKTTGMPNPLKYGRTTKEILEE